MHLFLNEILFTLNKKNERKIVIIFLYTSSYICNN